MKNILKIKHESALIIMDRTFAKKAENTRSEEYTHLQKIRQDYPTYEVITKTIKKNEKKESYKGLTYEYMRHYIRSYEPITTRKGVLDELETLIDISRCHSQRYPVIKQWFLNKYPVVEKFGMPKLESDEISLEEPIENSEKAA